MNASLDSTGQRASSPSGRRVAIITGGSQGIGTGLVSGFRREGYAVVATSRSIGGADEDNYLTVRGDIAEAQTARNVMEHALNRFVRIHCLVNDAGVFIGKPFTDYTLQTSPSCRYPATVTARICTPTWNSRTFDEPMVGCQADLRGDLQLGGVEHALPK